MKRGILIASVIMLLSLSFISAACNLEVSMLNQDPYPASPGDYVKLVFQVTGVENPECKQVSLELVDQYPISFDPNESSKVQIKGGTFVNDYSSYLLVPYKVRVDKDAVNGDNKIEVRYGTDVDGYLSKQFNLAIKDIAANFDVFVKNYDPATKEFTLEILNVGKTDVSALTVEIPKQENITVKGANINVAGDVDTNEYTTADFTATPKQGDINLVLSYTDAIGKRRTIDKTISFDPSYFEGLNQKATPWGTYIIILVIVGGIAYYIYRRRKKKKEHQKRMMIHHKK